MRKSTIFKIGLTFLLIIALLIKINPAEIIQILSASKPQFFIAACLCVIILYIVRVYRWDFLLQIVSIKKSFLTLWTTLFIGVFYGLITPGKIGELGRIYHIEGSKPILLSSIIAEKIIDIYLLFFLSTFTIIIYFNNNRLLLTGIIICGIFIFLITIMFNTTKLLIFFTKFFKISDKQVKIFVECLRLQFRPSKKLLLIILLSFLYYLIAYILGIFLLLSLQIERIAVISLPLIIIMGNIPLTISGLGLRESIGAFTFSLLGFPAAAGFSFSLFLFGFMILLPGFFGYLLSMKSNIESSNKRNYGQITGFLSPILAKWRIKKIIKLIRGNEILDFGCGMGTLADYVREKNYYGVDINEDVIQSAKHHYHNKNKIHFYTYQEFEKLDLQYDTIILSAVIEHLSNPQFYLSNFKNLLTTGGRIIITTPTTKAQKILEIGARFNLFSKEAADEHQHLFNRTDFEKFSNEIGLEIEYYGRFEFGLNPKFATLDSIT